MSDHPRIRGEHSSRAQPGHPAGGSSPHTRGARTLTEINHPDVGIIPAYAGSTGEGVGFFYLCGDHPRIRGEHKTIASLGEEKRRIIPAYAGSTPGSAPSTAAWTDHPRIRGEHMFGPVSFI